MKSILASIIYSYTCWPLFTIDRTLIRAQDNGIHGFSISPFVSSFTFINVRVGGVFLLNRAGSEFLITVHFTFCLNCLLSALYTQLSAVMTRSNIVRNYTNDCRNWGRISTRCWIHKRHPYLALTGELWGVFCEYLWENWPRYNGTALYCTNHYLRQWGPKFLSQTAYIALKSELRGNICKRHFRKKKLQCHIVAALCQYIATSMLCTNTTVPVPHTKRVLSICFVNCWIMHLWTAYCPPIP